MRLFSIVQPIAGSSRQATASCRRVSRCAVPHCQRSRRQQSTLRPSNYTIDGKVYPTDSYSNIPPSILAKLDRRLHDLPSHPIAILRQLVESHFSTHTPVSPSSPIVTVTKNFDELGFAPDHPGRSMTDSYYLNKEYMLRTHTSAHEIESYAKGLDRWLLSADVYRRDEIDSSHYPVFHQMEGTQVWSQSDLHTLPELNAALAAQIAECPLIIEDTTRISPSNPYQVSHDSIHAEQIDQHLKHSLNSLIFRLFGPMVTKDGEPLRVRWIEAFFPFTTPSYEVEVWWNGQWLELLGSGVVMQKTLELAGVPDKSGWAFGIGLERLAMVLFSIPDIRLFWSTDPRFIHQFTPGQITTFTPYSKYPPCLRDMSFWIPDQPTSSASTTSSSSSSSADRLLEKGGDGGAGEGRANVVNWHENDYCEIVRDVVGDLIENVENIDEFTHPKLGRKSKTYRLKYRSMDRSLSNDEVNVLHAEVERRVVEELAIEMR